MKKIIALLIVIILIVAAGIIAFQQYEEPEDEEEDHDLLFEGEGIIQEFTFSYPTFDEDGDYTCVYVDEADFYDIHDGRPSIPVKTMTYEFPFGTKIVDIIYEHSEPETITLSKKISYGSCSTATGEDPKIYDESTMFPSSFVSYKTGGGLSNGEHKTFLTVRVNPFIYRPADYEIDFIEQFKFSSIYRIT